MLPGNFVFAFVGASIPSLAALQTDGWNAVVSWQLLLALGLLAVFPVAARFWLARRDPKVG